MANTKPDASQITYTAAGGVLRTQANKNAESVSVLDFGGVVNSSGATVRTANKAALIAAMAAAKRVYIPEGVFWTDPDIEIPSGTHLIGSGKTSTTIKCDGDLFKVSTIVTAEIRIEFMQIQNDVTRGKLIRMLFAGFSQGLTCKDVYFNTALNHFYATAGMVNQYFHDCTFLDSSSNSRVYAGGAYACHEFNTYTWNCAAGILVQSPSAGMDSYSCSLNSCVFEQLQFEALQLNTGTVVDIENWALNSCHFEFVSLASPATVPYVKLLAGTGKRLWNVQFNDCSFMAAPAGLVEFVTAIAGGGTLSNITFSGGQALGSAHLCSNLTAVTVNDVGFNSAPTYELRPSQSTAIKVQGSARAVIGATGQVNPLAVPSTEWNMDFTQNTAISIANGGTYDLAAGSGLLVLGEAAGQVMGLLFLAVGTVTLITNATGNITVTADTAAKLNVFYNAPTTSYRIQNNTGATVNLLMAMQRVRAAN